MEGAVTASGLATGSESANGGGVIQPCAEWEGAMTGLAPDRVD